MSHSALLELFDDYAAEILRRQDESWQSPSPEAFHQLRVYIKRMRALLGLVDELAGGGQVEKRRKVFRDVFKSAGTVRDLHVQIDLVRSVEEKAGFAVDWYRDALEQREREAIESFICRHDAMLHPREIAKVRAAVAKALSRKTSVELASLAWQHFGTCLTNTVAFDVDSKDLHDLRKRTKEASNLTWILERVFPEVELELQLKELLDDLQNQLGKWHDFDVAALWAESVAAESVPDEERNNWQRFIHALRRKRGGLRTKVMRRWNKLVENRAGRVSRPSGSRIANR